MSRFKKVLNVETSVQGSNGVVDPRPDLSEDSSLWVSFLTLAARESQQLFEALHGFRCCGTRLVQAASGTLAGMYVLRPDIDPTGANAWTSQDEYEKWKAKYLKPLEPQLLKVLKQFNQRMRESA